MGKTTTAPNRDSNRYHTEPSIEAARHHNTDLRERQAGKVDQEKNREERPQIAIEAIPKVSPKRNTWFEEHPGHKKEHGHVERADNSWAKGEITEKSLCPITTRIIPMPFAISVQPARFSTGD